MTGYSESAKALIRKWDEVQEKEITLALYLPGTPEDTYFEHLADQFESETRKLKMDRISQFPGRMIEKRPAIVIDSNIIYSALSYDRELSPFLDVCTWLNNPPELSRSTKAGLDQVNKEISLKLYIAQACPHCPEVVRTVVGLALSCRNIFLEIIDGTLFGESARKDAVMSAPCLILDNDFRWTGQVSAEEICQMMVRRDSSQLSVESLRTILEEGKALWIKEEMIRQNKIFDGFISLLLHELWSVRLGAMVVVESLAEENPGLALKICPYLFEKFNGRDTAAQGDILYALGEAGDMGTRAKIQELLKTITDETLVEAAMEAIETIDGRY